MLFLDTNIVLKLLGLHYGEFKEPVKELFKLIRNNKFKLFVFDFTLEEARTVLNACPQEIEPSEKIKINSVCAYLKREERKNNAEIQYISANLENLLKKENIDVWRTGISISSYTPTDEKLLSLLKDRKPNQRRAPRFCDVAAVEYIRHLRKNELILKLEESKALFLTGDRILSKLVHDNYHKIDNSISEVILDKLLTNLLWLNNPSIDVNIDSIVASCCKDVFINRDIWVTFINVFNELKNKGDLTEEDYRSLFYLNYIEEALGGYTQRDLGKITPEFVKVKVDEQKVRLERMNDKLKNLIKKFVLIFRISSFAILVLLATVLFALIKIREVTNIYALIVLYLTIGLLFIILTGVGPFGKIWNLLTQRIAEEMDFQGKLDGH